MNGVTCAFTGRVGGNPERRYSQSDLLRWSEALSGLIAERAAAERMGMAGRDLAVARYSVAVLAPRLAALLRRLA